MSRDGNEARRQRRRENAGKRLKLCSRCNQRLARHRGKEGRLCCSATWTRGRSPQTGISTAWRPTRSERGDDWTECSTRIGLAPGNRHSASTAATGTTEYLVRSKNSCGD
jgi:hypothetical protein